MLVLVQSPTNADPVECRLENRIVKFEIWDTAGQGT